MVGCRRSICGDEFVRRVSASRNLAVDGELLLPAAALLLSSAPDTRMQELLSGAILLVVGAGFTATFLGLLMCCSEKCTSRQLPHEFAIALH
jgi:hypothetical protein